MNKKEFIKCFKAKRNFDFLKESQRRVESILSTLEETVIKGHNVVIFNFGVFKLNSIPARKYYTPMKNEYVEKPARKKIIFSYSRNLRNRLNKEGK